LVACEFAKVGKHVQDWWTKHMKLKANEDEGAKKGDCVSLWSHYPQGIKHFEALCKALAKQVCDNKTKKNTTGKSKNACNDAVAAADSEEDEPLEED